MPRTPIIDSVCEITAEFLDDSLQASAKSFAAGELAYLALTSKVELPIRDRLAWCLHTSLPNRVVAREWKRCDLAVLDDDGVKPLSRNEDLWFHSGCPASPSPHPALRGGSRERECGMR